MTMPKPIRYAMGACYATGVVLFVSLATDSARDGQVLDTAAYGLIAVLIVIVAGLLWPAVPAVCGLCGGPSDGRQLCKACRAKFI